jgi:DNA-binding GntR family transcriptional regulator
MPRYRPTVHIDHEGPEPVYQQIAGIIRDRIHSGEYAPKSAVPSIERIRQETGCAVKTIRKGIKLLAKEGFVVIVPGKGTFVNPPEMWQPSE